MKTKILADFQICITVPLRVRQPLKYEIFIFHKFFINTLQFLFQMFTLFNPISNILST